MDCEKFEAALMDELYGELDELTSAAMKRHAAGCARCASLLSGLSATRRLAAIPAVDVPAGLEERILAAAREAQKVVPVHVPMPRRGGGVLSMAGRWAMRPQTAMAAVFLVMVGTSVLFISGKASRAPASASITVTEQGSPAAQVAAAASAPATTATPSPEPYGAPASLDKTPTPAASMAIARADSLRDETAPRAAPGGKGYAGAASTPPKDDDGLAMNGPRAAMSPAPTAAAAPMVAGGGGDLGGVAATEKKVSSPSSPIAAAIQTYQAGRYDDATHAFDALAPDPNAALWAARSVRESKGCKAALARFDQASQRGAGSPPGWDALLEGGLCYRSLGDLGNARLRFAALLKVDSHKDRAQAELDRTNQMSRGGGQGGAGAGGAAKAAAPAPAAPPPPASRPPAANTDQSY
jgi:hypothetical protein